MPWGKYIISVFSCRVCVDSYWPRGAQPWLSESDRWFDGTKILSGDRRRFAIKSPLHFGEGGSVVHLLGSTLRSSIYICVLTFSVSHDSKVNHFRWYKLFLPESASHEFQGCRHLHGVVILSQELWGAGSFLARSTSINAYIQVTKC